MDLAGSSAPRRTVGLVLAVEGALFVAAGGLVHLREWVDTYRDVPSAAPGALVVTLGFPVNAAASLLLAAALVVAAVKVRRLLPAAIAANLALQLGSLAALVLSRQASIFGWSEPRWTAGAKQTLVVELAALAHLAALGGLAVLQRRRPAEGGRTPVVQPA